MAAARDVARDQADNRLAGGERTRSERSGGPAPVVIRLHSALPIRQALTRLSQINANYDKMDESGKAKFDEGSKVFLQCPICQDYYVVTLTQFPNSSGQSVEEGMFQGMTLEQMKGNVWLVNEKREKRELVQFTPAKRRGDSAVFFFARKDDKGSVFLTTANSSMEFMFNSTFLSPNNRHSALVPTRFEFNVSKMLVGEKLMF